LKEFRYCPLCAAGLVSSEIEGRLRSLCPGCGWVNYKNPLPASACIVRDGDKVLLVRRAVDPFAGRWSLPGGFIEAEETPEDGALRELYEETGIRGKIERLLGVYSQETGVYGNVLVIGFLAVMTGGRLKAGSDVSEACFGIPEEADIPFESQRRMLGGIKGRL